MAWSEYGSVFTSQNIQLTNMLDRVVGSGVPVSSLEQNIGTFLRSKNEQEIYRSLSPSGFLTKISHVSKVETTLNQDVIGELAAVTTSNIFVANKLRLGMSWVVVNGWKIPISNTAGTNGIHNDIILDTAPTSGSRIDLVFLEVWVAELGGSSASITNTANKPTATSIWLYGNTQYAGNNRQDDISQIDAEIDRRWQIQYRIRTVDGVNLTTYPDGVNDTVNVKAWGTNPNGAWAGSVGGVGSVYTFQNANSFTDNLDIVNDPGLYIAGDGSTTAQSILGTVDGYVYAIPIAAVFRRNSGIYSAGTNPYGCAAAGPNGGNIASGISGRPDGFYYDQVDRSDILSLRHQTLIDSSIDIEAYANQSFNDILRGNLESSYGYGDGVGAGAGGASTNLLYAQEIAPEANVDPGFKGLSQFNYQRRIFSDELTVQQTEVTFEGGPLPDNPLPTILSAPATPVGSTSTTSGTLTAGSYAFVITEVNQYGETTPSPQSATYTLSTAGTLTVDTPPSASNNATGYNVYITATPGSGWEKQNSTPVPIGTNYVQSVPLVTGSAPPTVNTTSSTLVITASSSGLVVTPATVACVDGTTVPGSGNLNTGANILVYNANTFAVIAGTWTGLGTVSAIFTPTNGWGTNDTTYGVVAIVAFVYPAGNGILYRPSGLATQTVVQGATVTNEGIIGVTGIAAPDNLHLNNPSAVFVDSSFNIYIADTLNQRIVKFNSSFVYQTQFGVTGVSGSDNTHLNNPLSITGDSSGNLYVSDSLNHRVVKLNSNLSYVSQFGVTGVSGSDTSHLNYPNQVSLDPAQANLYIADNLNNRIVRLTVALAYAATPIATITSPVGVVVDAAGNIHVTTKSLLQTYTSAGVLTTSIGATGSSIYDFSSPAQLNFSQGGHLLVADSGNQRIVKYNAFSIYVGQLGVSGIVGSDLSHFNSPFGVCVDSNDVVYIADTLNNRVLKMHQEMGSIDFPVRKLEIMKAGANTDKLQFFYFYKPYQGVIGNQGSASFNYTLLGLTDIKAFATTTGTGGKNILLENEMNGLITRLPFPSTYYGSTTYDQIESVENAVNFVGGTLDPTPLLFPDTVSVAGSSSVYSTTPNGNQGNTNTSNRLLVISQGTQNGYPLRGVNTLEKFVSSSYPFNQGYESIGISYGNFNNVDHITYGYFLAVASGQGNALPLIPGEVVLVVVGFRVLGTGVVLYSQSSIATAVDIYRLNSRPVVRYYASIS